MALSVQAPVAEVEADDEASATQLSDWITNLGLLLTLPPGGAMQLAVLRCGVRYAHRLLGYVHALSAADKECPPLLRGPLVCWDEAAVQGADAEELAAALDSLITYLRSNNPVVQRYLTMAERQWGNDTVSAAHVSCRTCSARLLLCRTALFVCINTLNTTCSSYVAHGHALH